jgi:hypothetical protein
VRPIWASDKKNHWLYVEQAAASSENKPYRQRVYKLELSEQGFKSIIYTLPEQEKWAGAYKNPALFNSLKPSDLVLREGCTVYIHELSKGVFDGFTLDDDCESNLRGAKYATTKVVITPKVLLSWDQGYSEKGEQVWGAKKGWYVFVKK